MPDDTPDQPDPREWDISDTGDTSSLEGRIGQLVNELEDAKARTLRVMADYNNYQRRALQNERQARVDGVATVVKSVVGVIDHFDVALTADLSKASAAQIVDGVRVIREELIKAIGQHGVRLISPAPGDVFEPGKHEAVVQMPSDDVPSGHIVQTFQAGYAMENDRVLRPAKVAVAP
ncbi:MAG: nucleotide exchange factor GrpE [Planctomycetota bacterium]|nr:nucleotide exchange factor GrpE [Planctomycetota bacterium]